MAQVVVVTGAGAGVGRATAREFARNGCDVGLIGRESERLEAAAAELRGFGVRAFAVPTDVADPDAVEAAVNRFEQELGPIDIWVNNAMVTVFSPVADVTPAEVKRATEVTYLGTVYCTMAVLKRMRTRQSGTIINVGSALAYRSIPLQAPYCGAKSAIRGFTDSLRSELLHDRAGIHVTMVHLPAVNTPQFDWALDKLGRQVQPVPPIFQPEVAARAIHFAAFNHRREIWVGFPTVTAILANRIAPGLADWYLAGSGYSGQMTDQPKSADAPSNLFAPVAGNYAAHGRFDSQARAESWEMFTSRHRDAITIGLAGLALLGLRRWGLRRWLRGSG
ncbi:MAG TPA: SDR family oxidoreductase [Rhodopila sp.]|nr:SDR family oxidoreductase [Rhodopila sp.]